MNMPNLTHSAPLFKECQVMPNQDQVKFRTVTMVSNTHIHERTYQSESPPEIPGIAKQTNYMSQAFYV